MTFVDLWKFQGTVGRGAYALAGILGFALKHNLDRFVATYGFGRKWGLFNYWIPPERLVRVDQLTRDEARFLAVMVAMALPFIWIGVAMTVRRLRDAGLPLWLTVLFFAPVVNLLFFLVLSLIPSHAAKDRSAVARSSVLDRIIPESMAGSAAMAVLIAAASGVFSTGFGVATLLSYGWGLFVGLPFILGLLSTVLYGYHRPRDYGSSLLVALLTILLTSALLIALAIEGLACVLMAAPLAVPLALMGATLGWLLQRRHESPALSPLSMLLLALSVPVLMAAEAATTPEPPLFAVRTSIEVNAPPEAVWRHVVAFSELPPPPELLFRAGIAYPMRARIEGSGPGAVRYCEFSTGAFVEPIEVWDAPRLLKFSVTSNPPAMQEWSPYANIAPPHVRDFLQSKGGQFLLSPLPGNRTRLEGTTWYHHRIEPAGYWTLWSDAIIHRIHTRVLRHVKELSESGRH